ncbi:MAG: acyltransferase family protein [Phycisphaerales bacterium]
MADPQTPKRLSSLDALRGFDMFCILGVEEFAERLRDAKPAAWSKWFADRLSHVDWAGFHFLDLIFPLFVFLSGASVPFSVSRSVEQHGKHATAKKLCVRFLILCLLGVIYYGGYSRGFDDIRWVGVLQRIAFCNLVTGLLFCYAGRTTRIATGAAVLLGYWVLMSFVPVPGGVAGDFAEGPAHNWANWVDFHYLPGKKWDKTHDPEGLLSNLPAIATCLLGCLAGERLKRTDTPPASKALALIAVGVVLAGIGWAWSLQFPVIKKLWTSSYVLVAGGYSFVLLGAFYWVIDVKGWTLWSRPFVWIGMNAITLYMLRHLFEHEKAVETLLGGPIGTLVDPYGKALLALGVCGLNILIAWFLYSRKIFLRA